MILLTCVTRRFPFSSRARGFTLVELLVVVAIIGILILIAIPMQNNVRTQTKNVSAMTSIRSIEKIVAAYSIDNGGNFPSSLADVGQQSVADPWGNHFQYTNLALHPELAMVDFLGNPLNSDFDLYSKGVDGQSSTKDDVVRAGDGGYVGLASGTLMP